MVQVGLEAVGSSVASLCENRRSLVGAGKGKGEGGKNGWRV